MSYLLLKSFDKNETLIKCRMTILSELKLNFNIDH